MCIVPSFSMYRVASQAHYGVLTADCLPANLYNRAKGERFPRRMPTKEIAMKYLGCTIVVILLLAVGFFVAAWSGVYNISARVPHWTLTRETIEMVRDRSIRQHSEETVFSRALDQIPETAGAGHFHATCRLCHGAPGVPPGEFAAGMYPAPPDLHTGRAATEFDANELLWIVSNGLKMTGMPAFGGNHAKEEREAVVAFVIRLPEFDADRYREITADAGHHGHSTEETGEDGHHDAHDHTEG